MDTLTRLLVALNTVRRSPTITCYLHLTIPLGIDTDTPTHRGGRMKTFQVFTHPTIGNQAVKAGFCWPAACFGIIWILASQLWGKAARWLGIFLGLLVLLSIIREPFGIETTTLGQLILTSFIVLWILPGFSGNEWRIKLLENRGFELLSTLQAESRDAAITSASTQSPKQQPDLVGADTPSPHANSTLFSIRKLSNFRFFCWFTLVNAGIVTTFAIVTAGAGLPLAVVVVIIASAGSVLSLFFSRWLATRAHSIVIINDKTDHELAWLVATVDNLSKKVGLPSVPQIGVWPGPEANAFATGPSRKRALVAFSSSLLEHLSRDEVAAVAAHELAHIANRDMLAMTLLQGVANTFVLTAIFPLQIFRLFNFLSDRFSWGAEFAARLIKFCIAVVLTFIASLFIKAFSRHREYRADAVAAQLVGAEHMKSALQRLSGLSAGEQQITQFQASFAVYKISGRGLIELLSTHPLVEKRIDALEQNRFAP